jgi:hypothetical protein
MSDDIEKANELILEPGTELSRLPWLRHRMIALQDSELFEFSTQHFDSDSHRIQKGGLVKKRIHVNQHIIRSNRKNNEREPVLTVKTYKSNDYCHEAIIDGPCRVIYSPDKPLSCGARVWIETDSEVVCVIRGEENGND